MSKWTECAELPSFLDHLKANPLPFSHGKTATSYSENGQPLGYIYAFLWGKGTASLPWILSVYYKPLSERFNPKYRLPTPDEVSEAMNLLVPMGVVLQPAVFMSAGEEGNQKEKSVSLTQIGAAEGTDAGMTWKLSVGVQGARLPELIQ